MRLLQDLPGLHDPLADKALGEAADALPELPNGSLGEASWRPATALVECLVSDEAPPSNVTVIVEADEAAGTNGGSGAVLAAGPRVAREALQAILCDATPRSSPGVRRAGSWIMAAGNAPHRLP